MRKTKDQLENLLRIDKDSSPIVILNNFLENPDEIRTLALQQKYTKDQVYPGMRSTQSRISGAIKGQLERIIGKTIYSLSTVFQYQTEDQQAESFVHGDLCDYAAVLYLNKDCDGRSGTSFYKHKISKQSKMLVGSELMFLAIEKGVQPNDIISPTIEDRLDLSKWECTLSVPVQFNRLLLYDAKLFHRNTSAWGNNLNNARLVQGFFASVTPPNKKEASGIEVIKKEDA